MKTKKMFLPLFAAIALYLPASAQWSLVWSDEFNGSTINTANWVHETGGGGWGNNELENYTNRAVNSTVSNGNLLIIAKKENYGGSQYTSARMKTAGLQSWQYGRIEGRMKLPIGKGIWPAFWMLGNNISTVGWPACGEIDIMEHINTEAVTYGTIHWDNNGHVSYGKSQACNVTQYHTYAVEWDADSMKWFLDGNRFTAANIKNGINGTGEFHAPFFIILNMAIGGQWPGSPDGTTPFPDTMFVDYVRVYKKATGGSSANGTLCNETQPLVIDGAEESTWLSVKKDTAKKVITGTVGSSADLFGTYRATWDTAALYLLVNVKDDSLKNDSGNATWDDDAVEVFIDGNNEKVTAYDANDRQYIFRYNDPTVYEYHGAVAQPVNPAGVTFAQTNITGGYQMEMRIAWSAIGAVPAKGKLVGFDLHVNDDDNGAGRDTKVTWISAVDQSSQNPSLFGTIRLDSVACTLTTTQVAQIFDHPQMTEPYPNPASTQVTVGYFSLENERVEIAIMDMLSRVVKKERTNAVAGENAFVLNTSTLKSGTYFVSVRSPGAVVTKKIVVLNRD